MSPFSKRSYIEKHDVENTESLNHGISGKSCNGFVTLQQSKNAIFRH